MRLAGSSRHVSLNLKVTGPKEALGNCRRSPRVEVRDSPARDICSLHVVLQGSHQMGWVLGTPPPPPSPPPSPSPGSSGWHSGWGTIFGVCPDGIGLRWDISGHPYRGFAQNFDTFYMGIVVLPGEPFWNNHKKTRKFTLRKWTCLKFQKNVNFPEKKKNKTKKRRRPTSTRQPEAFKNTGSLWNCPFLQKVEKVSFSRKVRFWLKKSGQSQKNAETSNGPCGP